MSEAVAHATEVVEVRIPARAEWVAVARLAIAAVAHRMPFSLEEIEDLKLAVAEACTTAIQYADAAEAIHIACDVSEDALRLVVRHRQAAGSPTGPEAASSELGLVLIEALMDDVSYAVDPDGASRLEMTKRLQA